MKRFALVAAAALTLSGCGIISRPVVSAPRAQCASLVPDTWKEGVSATPVPDTQGLSLLDQVKAWASAYVGMNGQLEKANGRTVDTVSIVERCEALVNAARADD